MQVLAEQNARRSRRNALWITVAVHLALGAALYLNTSTKPEKADPAPTAQVEKAKPAGKAKVAPIP